MAEQIDLSAGMESPSAPTTPSTQAPQSSPADIDLSAGMEAPEPTRTPATGIAGVLSGIGGEVMETAQGAKNLANKVLPQSAQIPDIPKEYRENTSTSEKIGGGIEQLGEFAAGDEALKGLANLGKIPEGLLALAEKYPKTAKILLGGAKAAGVGGAQGAVKGAAEGKTAAGAEGGAIGGAVGGVVGETASELAQGLSKTLGMGTTSAEDAARGVRPAKRNYRFADDFQNAAPRIDAQNAITPAKSVEDWADNVEQARKDLYAKEIDPLVQKHATQPLGGLNIAEGIRAQIPNAMKVHDPEQAAKMEELANKFMPGQVFQLSIGDSEDTLQHYNAKLAATGFWSKMPSERAAMLKTDGNIAGLKAAGDSIRDEFYTKLGQLEPGSDIASLKKQYGSLRNVEDEIRGRVNVNNRQSPISLKETIGLITGLGHGGPVGAAMAAIPVLDRMGNSPENLISRAVQKAVRPGETSAASKIAKGAGTVAKELTPAGASGIGQTLAEGQPEQRVTFTASDGSVHSVPASQIQAAMQIDPKLIITNQ